MVSVKKQSDAMSTTSSSDFGAGLSLTKPSAPTGMHPAGPPQHGAMGQAERAFSAASTFLSGILAISASQFVGAPLKLVDPKFYDGYMAWTKESFAVLITTITQWWAPTVVRVTGDESMKGQLYQMEDGSLKCNFPHRLVLMANHQLYTDWLYLWWIAYTNNMHGRIYIILKESFKNVPIFGWGAQFYNFIFLSRKWETDKPRFRHHLQQLRNALDPMWLLIFPEGTNLSSVTREKSKAWAQKQGIPDMQHQLLPRSTGLHFCLDELKQSTNWLYDCTIAYEGVPKGQFGQDIFTLRSSLFEGRPPKSVNMYWRRWRISDIPLESDEAFGMWLRNRWTEKDYLLEHFALHGNFPEGDPAKLIKQKAMLHKFAEAQSNGDKKTTIKPVLKPAKFITTEVKAGGWEEFSGIFAPIATAATALSSDQLAPHNIDFDALMAKVARQQNLAAIGPMSRAPRTAEEARNSLMSASKQAGQPLKGPTIPNLVQNAPQAQKELTQAASKTKGLPSPKAGKQIDPSIQKLFEDAHEATRQGLVKASAPANRKAPNVRNSIPMTPMETIVTRPFSTIAVQRAGQALQGTAPAVGARKEKLAKATQKATGALTGQQQPKAQGQAPKQVRLSTAVRKGSVQSTSSASTSTSTQTNEAPKKPVHPLAGRKVTRTSGQTSAGHTPIGQKKVPKPQ